MNRTLATVAVVATIAATSFAADIPISLGNIVVKDAQQPAVIAWLATESNLYTNGIEVVDGETNTVKMLVSETPKQKAARCMKAKARAAIRKAVSDVEAANAVRAVKQKKAFDEAP